jgi:hypothetical protein
MVKFQNRRISNFQGRAPWPIIGDYGSHLWFAEKPEVIYGEHRECVGGVYKPYGTPELKNRSLGRGENRRGGNPIEDWPITGSLTIRKFKYV